MEVAFGFAVDTDGFMVVYTADYLLQEKILFFWIFQCGVYVQHMTDEWRGVLLRFNVCLFIMEFALDLVLCV